MLLEHQYVANVAQDCVIINSLNLARKER